MLSGRYLASDGSHRLELRSDLAAPGALNRVSGDLYELPAGGAPRHLAAFRTPALDPAAAGSFDADLELVSSPLYVGGRLRLAPGTGEEARVELELSRGEGEEPGRWSFEARRVDGTARSLRLLLHLCGPVLPPDGEGLEPVRAPAGAEEGEQVTFSGALERAGVRVEIGTPLRLPPDPQGEEHPWSDAELYEALRSLGPGGRAAADPGAPLEVPLLIVPRGERPRVVGVTFETGDPEIGKLAAIFFDMVRSHDKVRGDETRFAREYLFTCVHELGHLLGLPHAWEALGGVGEPERGRDSLTFMNYPHRYRRGYSRFYREFPFTFREEELLHLRHAPGPLVDPRLPDSEPDSSDFMLAPFAAEDREPLDHPRLHLELRVPAAGRLPFAATVHLELKLANRSRRRVAVPGDLLDPEGGRLRVWVEGPGAGGEPRRLQPVVARDRAVPALVLGAVGRERGEPTDALYETVHLTYERRGFPFAEPGAYRIWAAADVGDGFAVRGGPVEIEIGAPARADEAAAADLLGPEVGLALALGGDPESATLERLRQVVRSGRPAGLVPWAAYRVGEAVGRGFRRLSAERRSWRRVLPRPGDALRWLRTSVEQGEWPDPLRSRLLEAWARCGARAGRLEEVERAAARLRERIETRVTENRRLRRRLLREAGRLRRRLREEAIDAGAERSGSRRDREGGSG